MYSDYAAHVLESIREDRSKTNIEQLIDFTVGNKHNMKDLIPPLKNEPGSIGFRIGWMLETMSVSHPELVCEVSTDLFLLRDEVDHPGFHRSVSKILANCGIPEEHEGLIVDTLFTWLQSPESDVAVKVHAMTALCNICEKHPDLINELQESINSQIPFESVAFLSRGKKILKRLEILQKK